MLLHATVRGGGSIPATVLDPFGGAGTTALVARRLGRSSVSFDINAGYCEMAENRLRQDHEARLAADR